MIGHVEEIVLRDPNHRSSVPRPASTGFTRETSVKSFSPMIRREVFSGTNMFEDGEEETEEEMEQFDTMKTVYVDTMDEEESLEVSDAMEIAVVAEVGDGISN